MSSPDQILNGLENFNWWVLPKAGILFLLFLFIVFGLLVLRQIQLMARVVSGTSNLSLKILAYLGLFMALVVWLAAYFVL